MIGSGSRDDLQPVGVPAQPAPAEGKVVITENGMIHQAISVVTEATRFGAANGHGWQYLFGFGLRLAAFVV